MKKIIFMFLLGILFSNQTKAQGFVHANQMSMYYNPSFAGSKGDDRLSVLTNYQKNNNEKSQNNYASYDLLVKKLGSGLGVAVYNFNNDRSQSSYRYGTYNTGGIKLAFAPKYLIKKRDGSTRATFSPSIGVGFSASNVRYAHNERYYEFHYSDRPTDESYYSGYESMDYIWFETQHNRAFETSLGLLYNSKYLLLGLTVTNKIFNNTFINRVSYPDRSDTIRYWYGGGPKPGEYGYESWRDTYTFSNLDSTKGTSKISKSYQVASLYASYTVKHKKESKFSITPLLQLGVAYVPNLPRNSYHKSDFKFYSFNLNTTFQYSKFFVGLGTNTLSYQYFAGFQNEKMRIMIGSLSKSLELSLNYYFKRNE